jgi:hypothetical protein
MSQDPNLQVDQTVLDMIDHSPTGAVPFTPAYRDALRRLYAAHQAYPSADYKDGHVTARSLVGKPAFRAGNIEVLGANHGDELEPNDAIFDRYVKSLPGTLQGRAESLRRMVAGRPALHRAKHGLVAAHDPVHTLFLVPGSGVHHGLPGNYLFGFVAEGAPGVSPTGWSVHLHDAEDGAVLYHASTVMEAVAKLEEVMESAPFHLGELEALGFKFT